MALRVPESVDLRNVLFAQFAIPDAEALGRRQAQKFTHLAIDVAWPEICRHFEIVRVQHFAVQPLRYFVTDLQDSC